MPESRLLPVSGTIRMPPGITVADVTVTYLGVLRGGGLVSGGTLKAQAGADGVPKVNGAALQLQVAFPGDRVDQHPFAKVGVSYRGGARGYEFLVDLAMEAGAASVPLDRVSSGSEVMSPAQVQTVQELIADLGTAKEEARAAAQKVTTAQLDLSRERKKVEQTLADTAQTTEELRSVAATYSLGRAPQAGDPAGMYRWVDPQGNVVDIAWNAAGEAVTTVALASAGFVTPAVRRSQAQAQSITTLAEYPRLDSETDDAPRIQRFLTRAAVLGLTAKGVAGKYVCNSRINIPAGLAYDIDLSGMEFDFAGVRDYNIGAMLQVQSPAPGSVLFLGSIGDSSLPDPTPATTKRQAPSPSDASWGNLTGKKDGPHWRSDSDHAVQIYGGRSFHVHSDVRSARAMGLVLFGCADVWATGTVAKALADGTHMYGYCHHITFSMTVTDTGDDAFPVVAKKTDSGLTHHIYYMNCTAERAGRGFVTGGGEFIFRINCTATDCMDQGFIEWADTGTDPTHGTNDIMAIVRHIRNTNCYAYGNGRSNPNALKAGENSSSGFHVSYLNNNGEEDIVYENCHAYDNYGPGFKTDGIGTKLINCKSKGNKMRDVFRGAQTEVNGGEFEQSVIRSPGVTLKNYPQFRKNGRTDIDGHALAIADDGLDGVQLLGVDFGAEWPDPIAVSGPLRGRSVIRDCLGLGVSLLPPSGTPGLANTPPAPGSGAGWLTNTTPFDVTVMIQGGTVLSINLKTPRGSELDMGAARTFRLPRGWSVNPYWSAQPDKWFWALMD